MWATLHCTGMLLAIDTGSALSNLCKVIAFMMGFLLIETQDISKGLKGAGWLSRPA